jgi:hypothetical protein
MLAFEIDVSIVKWVMKALGKPINAASALSPIAMPGMLPGAVYRTDAPYGWPGAYAELPPGPGPPAAGWSHGGQTASWPRSQDGQPGHPAVENGDPAGATKRQLVEAYLATLSPEERERLATLGPRAAAREVTAALGGHGTQVSERYVTRILDQRTAPRRGSAGPRRRGRR